jgi:predicted transcriptional regulator
VSSQQRTRPVVQITLSLEARDRLDEMAERVGESRSAMVERLVRDAEMPRRRGSNDDG